MGGRIEILYRSDNTYYGATIIAVKEVRAALVQVHLHGHSRMYASRPLMATCARTSGWWREHQPEGAPCALAAAVPPYTLSMTQFAAKHHLARLPQRACIGPEPELAGPIDLPPQPKRPSTRTA